MPERLAEVLADLKSEKLWFLSTNLTYHRLLLTGLNASDFTGLNAQNLQLGLGWDGMQIYERNSTMSTALQCQKNF